jgi:hypothetical protein
MNDSMSDLDIDQPSDVLRRHLYFSLLTSTAATLDPWTPSVDKTSFMLTLWKRSYLQRCLDRNPSPFTTADSVNLGQLELARSGLELLRLASSDLHTLHADVLKCAITLEAEARRPESASSYAGLDLLRSFCQVREEVSQNGSGGSDRVSAYMSAMEVSVKLHVEAMEKELRSDEQVLLRQEVHHLYAWSVALIVILRKIKVQATVM